MTYSRFTAGGDEFVAIVQSGQAEVIDSYAMKILDTFKIPYQIAVGSSIWHRVLESRCIRKMERIVQK